VRKGKIGTQYQVNRHRKSTPKNIPDPLINFPAGRGWKGGGSGKGKPFSFIRRGKDLSAKPLERGPGQRAKTLGQKCQRRSILWGKRRKYLFTEENARRKKSQISNEDPEHVGA